MSKEYKSDGWSNVLTGLGIRGKDRTASNKFHAEHRIDRNTLEAIYRSNGFAKKIVDIVANELTRKWFYIEGDVDGFVNSRLEEINAKNKITNLIRWSRLFGGAIAVIGIDDGRELNEPVDENQIRSLDFLHIFDRWQVTWNITDLYQDPNHKNFGIPEFYRVTPINTAKPFIVHESRVLRMDGETLPIRSLQMNEGWGDSVLQSVYNELKNLGVVYNCSANIIEDFIQTILSVDNLSDLLASGQEDLIKKRMDIIDLSRNIANTIILDSKESYSKESSSVSGLNELIDRFSLALSAVTSIPYTFLFGESASGLQSTGQSDIRMFYDMISSEQEDVLRPIMEKIVRIIMLSRDGPFNGREPENWSIKFNSLWQLTQLEEANYRKTIAETDAIYIDRTVVDPAEVAISRFGGDKFSEQTHIDLEMRNQNFDQMQNEEIQRLNDQVVKKDEKYDLEKEYMEVLKKIAEN